MAFVNKLRKILSKYAGMAVTITSSGIVFVIVILLF
jgi:hypothetical protein